MAERSSAYSVTNFTKLLEICNLDNNLHAFLSDNKLLFDYGDVCASASALMLTMCTLQMFVLLLLLYLGQLSRQVPAVSVRHWTGLQAKTAPQAHRCTHFWCGPAHCSCAGTIA